MKRNDAKTEPTALATSDGRFGLIRRAGRLVAVGFLLVSSGACRSLDPLHRTVAERQLTSDPSYLIVPDIEVPRTLALYGCGAQAMAAAMAYGDPSQTADAVYRSLSNRGKPTPSFAVLLIARAQGYKAKLARGSLELLRENVRNRIPTLVLFDRALFTLSSSELVNMHHWSVVSGLRLDGQEVLLAAPRHRHHMVSWDKFADRWAKTANCTISIGRPSSSDEMKRIPSTVPIRSHNSCRASDYGARVN